MDENYIKGFLFAFKKFAGDVTYPTIKPGDQDLTKKMEAKANGEKTWDLFDTKEKGFNEESSFSNP